jgi:hypothetical protein
LIRSGKDTDGQFHLNALQNLGLSLTHPVSNDLTLHIHPGLAFLMSVGFFHSYVTNAEAMP